MEPFVAPLVGLAAAVTFVASVIAASPAAAGFAALTFAVGFTVSRMVVKRCDTE